MSTIDEASGAVGSSADLAHELSAATARSKDVLDKLSGALAALNLDVKASEAGGIASDLESLAGQANAIAEAIEQVRTRVEGLRGLLASAGGEPAPPISVPMASSTRRRPTYDPVKAEPVVEFVGRRKTVGALYIDGERIGDLLWSGEAGPASDTTGVRPQWALKSSVRTHTEGHASAVMRSRRTREAEVYINRPVCDIDPDGCVQRIPEVLPPGYTLTVHDVTNPRSRPVILKGTGEGLTDDQ